MQRKVFLVMGTRPEIIKMVPVVRALQADPDFEPVIVSTSQHREMSAQFLGEFGVEARVDLDVMVADQSLGTLTARIAERLDTVLAEHRPDLVLIQGDTTTAAVSGLVSFYNRVPVGHIEAGLRTGNLEFPFPEELNRQIVGRYAVLNLVPTLRARENLLAESVAPETIHLTGNTVVDALQAMLAEDGTAGSEAVSGRRSILVTAHRRENHGPPLARICEALNRIAADFPEVRIVFPVHPNPRVREVVHASLGKTAGVELLDPLDYRDLVRRVAASTLVLTDSGGLQEEAPSLHKPVLVMREETERPEVVEAGGALLVGTDADRIVSTVAELLTDGAKRRAMAGIRNPFGDGLASRRIVEAIRGHFGLPVPDPAPSLEDYLNDRAD